MQTKIINFEIILPYWKILWPHMQKIEPTSPIDFGGKINEEIQKNKPIFLGVYLDKEIVGVNSILKTSESICRSRGLWVNSSKRKLGIGTLILEESKNIALKEGFTIMWSMPRYESLDFYLKNGFKKVSKLFYKYEFGPHCFVFKTLKEKI